VAVLAYRGIAFWLPILPGAAAWFSLQRTVAGWDRTSRPGLGGVQPAVAAA
jgi:hypothetical protein